MVAYRLHFEQGNLDAVERLRNREIGEPLIMSSVFCHQVRPGDIRAKRETGGGALFDMGIYCVNAARYLFRAEPEEVTAEQFIGTDRCFPNVDAMTTGVLRFSGGRVAQFTAGQSRCILEDLSPEPSGREGLADVRILEALVRSARSGKRIRLAPFAKRTRPSLRQAMRKPLVKKVETVHAPSPSRWCRSVVSST